MTFDGSNPKRVLKPEEKSVEPINSIFRILVGGMAKYKERKPNHNLTHNGKDGRFPMAMLARH